MKERFISQKNPTYESEVKIANTYANLGWIVIPLLLIPINAVKVGVWVSSFASFTNSVRHLRKANNLRP